MSWSTPKTDWEATDHFNIGDYNRWVNNLLYLQNLCTPLFNQPILAPMEEKEYSDLPYASDWNVIENNLEALNIGTYRFSIGTKKVYQGNGRNPDFEEMNRIESALLRLKIQMDSDLAILPRLPLTMKTVL